MSGEKVHQKRVPAGAPPWLETVRVHFPRYGLHADELCVDRAGRRDLGGADVDGRVPPLELPAGRRREARRVAHRPRPDARLPARPRCGGSPTSRTRCSTSSARSAGRRPRAARGCTSTSASSPTHGFTDVRRAALAFAREVERRAPDDVTTTWWRKDRDPAALFVDYNQNARDHTMAAAYSVRGCPTATVSTPITWDEVDDVEPDDCTMATVPARFAELGDLHAGIDDAVFAIDELLEWADRDERAGAVDTGRARGRGLGPTARADAGGASSLLAGSRGRVVGSTRRRHHPRARSRTQRPRPAAPPSRPRPRAPAWCS